MARTTKVFRAGRQIANCSRRGRGRATRQAAEHRKIDSVRLLDAAWAHRDMGNRHGVTAPEGSKRVSSEDLQMSMAGAELGLNIPAG